MRVIKNIVGILARNIQMYNVCHRSLSILHVWLAGKWRLLYENPWQFMLTDWFRSPLESMNGLLANMNMYVP